MRTRYQIQFPQDGGHRLGQDETHFFLQDDGKKHKIRFHDYADIYQRPGLYEQIFYERLKCVSPKKVAQILNSAIAQTNNNFTELRVLDLGAGNGMMAEALNQFSVSRLVGIDIIQEALEAALRDRPGLYDAYHIMDFVNLSDDQRNELLSWQLDCFVTVAALGFGDIPPAAFIEGFNLIKSEGWVAFNIKETFFDVSDCSGFSKTIRELIGAEFLNIYHLERYRHRLSIDGEPLYYFALAGRKNRDVPASFLESKHIHN